MESHVTLFLPAGNHDEANVFTFCPFRLYTVPVTVPGSGRETAHIVYASNNALDTAIDVWLKGLVAEPDFAGMVSPQRNWHECKGQLPDGLGTIVLMQRRGGTSLFAHLDRKLRLERSDGRTKTFLLRINISAMTNMGVFLAESDGRHLLRLEDVVIDMESLRFQPLQDAPQGTLVGYFKDARGGVRWYPAQR